MSFYTSLSGLKAAQNQLGTISNNIANAESTGFKKSRASFGDIFASSPMQGGNAIGQGVKTLGIDQQFTQGTFESTDKTLDLAITGEGFFTVKMPAPSNQVSYTRAGAFGADDNGFIMDSTGARLQLLPVDETTGLPTSTDAANLFNAQLPTVSPTNPDAILSSVSVNEKGLMSATFSDGSSTYIGAVAMASFQSQEGLRQAGEAHWTASAESGAAQLSQAGSGTAGSISSGMLERANVDISEELVSLISAQRNFQANAKAIETSNTMTNAIINMRS